MCGLGTWLAFGCHGALIADVHTDRWDLMVGVATGGRKEGREQGEERGGRVERGRREPADLRIKGRRKGKWSMDGRMDGWRVRRTDIVLWRETQLPAATRPSGYPH